jgi:hypothetical protein
LYSLPEFIGASQATSEVDNSWQAVDPYLADDGVLLSLAPLRGQRPATSESELLLPGFHIPLPHPKPTARTLEVHRVSGDMGHWTTCL